MGAHAHIGKGPLDGAKAVRPPLMREVRGAQISAAADKRLDGRRKEIADNNNAVGLDASR